ncbi:MAG: hypothetical protein NTY18_14575 [Deltaproteobacteria bacterium]|nr:hypothetical protein [Deltaproteobacteria bacterium]
MLDGAVGARLVEDSGEGAVLAGASRAGHDGSDPVQRLRRHALFQRLGQRLLHGEAAQSMDGRAHVAVAHLLQIQGPDHVESIVGQQPVAPLALLPLGHVPGDGENRGLVGIRHQPSRHETVECLSGASAEASLEVPDQALLLQPGNQSVAIGQVVPDPEFDRGSPQDLLPRPAHHLEEALVGGDVLPVVEAVDVGGVRVQLEDLAKRGLARAESPLESLLRRLEV